MGEIRLINENKVLNENFQSNIEELKNICNFFNTFINNFKNISVFQINKTKTKKGSNQNIYESTLSKSCRA